MLLAQETNSILPLAGVVVAMLLLLFTFWRIHRRGSSRSSLIPLREPFQLPQQGKEDRSQVSAQSGMDRGDPTETPPQFRSWEVQMLEIAREVSGWVDTKLRLLQHLVAEADRAATRLERALTAAEKLLGQTTQPTSASGDAPPGLELSARASGSGPQPGASPLEADQPKGAESENSSGFSSPDKNPICPQQEISSPHPLSPFEGSLLCRGEGEKIEPKKGPLRPQALRLEVGLLADYGFSLEEIASRCALSLSEVQALLEERNRFSV